MRGSKVLLAVLTFSCTAALVADQTAPAKLTKAQRERLLALVSAVDAAAAAPDTADVHWQTHMLRTSDGAHYVAFTITGAAITGQRPSVIYVRLATRYDDSAMSGERSAVMEWLKGMRSDPLVARRARGIAFGEMPTFGAGAIATRGPGQQASDLALLALERERARERQEAADKSRKAALEGKLDARPHDALFPFEDFSVDASVAGASASALRRSITAGPGVYELYVAWSNDAAKERGGEVNVVKRVLRLPPAATSDLALSSIIVADTVATRETAYSPDQQSSHPYAIGPIEIEPSLDEQFTNDERLSVVFQVLNAHANEAGKPDIAIGFQLFRVIAGGDQSVGSLNPQYYNATTLPPDFDLTKGHPIFAAMAASLKTLGRGEYRLQVNAIDKLSGRSASADALFHIVGTPATLLATAPAAPPMRREGLLVAPVLREAAAALRHEGITAALSAAIDSAGEGRFIDLLREDAIAPSEQSARTTLRGIGLYGVGDPRMAATMLRRSIDAGPSAVAQLYLGACRALEGNDREAVAAWQSALVGGMRATLVAPLLIEAYLRLGDVAHAADVARTVSGVADSESSLLRAQAAVDIAQGHEGDAISRLESLLVAHPDDLDAQYVMLHALFASFVHREGPGSTVDGKARFRALAQAYIDAKGRYAGLVSEWVAMIQ